MGLCGSLHKKVHVVCFFTRSVTEYDGSITRTIMKEPVFACKSKVHGRHFRQDVVWNNGDGVCSFADGSFNHYTRSDGVQVIHFHCF